MVNVIGYCRVSSRSLGPMEPSLEAQEAEIRRYAASVGGNLKAVYREVAKGSNDDRRIVANAACHARRSMAKLVVARLDRLSTRMVFIAAMMEKGPELVTCDHPGAGPFILHVLAATIEYQEESAREQARRDRKAKRQAKG